MNIPETASGPDVRRILGIDPGLNVTGYGVIEAREHQVRLLEAGIIRTNRRHSMPERLVELHRGLTEVIEHLRPDFMALEQLYSHYERPRTAILMGHARGTICLCAGQAGLEIKSFEPTKVKKLMTGNGRAPKHQIQLAVKIQLNLSSVPEPADVADALAIALCGHHQSRIGIGLIDNQL